MTNEIPMYLVPGRLTNNQATEIRREMIDGPILEPADMFVRLAGTIGTPIQPCVDVETVGWQAIRTEDGFPLEVFRSSEMTEWVSKAIKKPVDAVPLVRRTDMEAQVARVAAEKDAEIDRLKSALSNIRAACLRAAESPNPSYHMVPAGMKALRLSDQAINEGAAG